MAVIGPQDRRADSRFRAAPRFSHARVLIHWRSRRRPGFGGRHEEAGRSGFPLSNEDIATLSIISLEGGSI